MGRSFAGVFSDPGSLIFSVPLGDASVDKSRVLPTPETWRHEKSESRSPNRGGFPTPALNGRPALKKKAEIDSSHIFSTSWGPHLQLQRP